MRCTRACVYIRASGVSPRNVPFKIAREPKRRTKARGIYPDFFPRFELSRIKGEGRGREGCTCIEYCPWWQLSWNRDCSLLLLSFLFIYKLEISNKLEIRLDLECSIVNSLKNLLEPSRLSFLRNELLMCFTWKSLRELEKRYTILERCFWRGIKNGIKSWIVLVSLK